MSEVKRYAHVTGIIENPPAGYCGENWAEVVLATDYDALRAERDELKRCLDGGVDCAAERIALHTQLSAAEARLVKAREWMSHADDCLGIPKWENDQLVDGGCTCGLQAFLESISAPAPPAP